MKLESFSYKMDEVVFKIEKPFLYGRGNTLKQGRIVHRGGLKNEEKK